MFSIAGGAHHVADPVAEKVFAGFARGQKYAFLERQGFIDRLRLQLREMKKLIRLEIISGTMME